MSAVPEHVLAMNRIINEVFNKTPQPLPKQSRADRQRFIEDSISHFRPDYNEAMELLDSLLCGLRSRFNDNLGADVENDFADLRKALDEADRLESQMTYDPRDQYDHEEERE